MLSQPNPLDQLKSKIIRSFELGFDLERENDREKDRRWAGAWVDGEWRTWSLQWEEMKRVRTDWGERGGTSRNGEGGERKKKF